MSHEELIHPCVDVLLVDGEQQILVNIFQVLVCGKLGATVLQMVDLGLIMQELLHQLIVHG